MKFKSLLLILVFIVLLGVCFSEPANADEKKFSVGGKVIDNNANAVPSVRLVIYELKKQIFTNTKGEFVFRKIGSGVYHFHIARIGYRTLDTIINVNSDVKLRFILKESDVITNDIVVTGTRTYKHIENLPMPVEVVAENEIKKQGYLRLDEVLSQEMGIPLSSNHGRGMQVQGLGSDYTLVMLNGEPLSGRTGGVLDISRFSVGDMSRIEVVRGPSSSLYGSSALAGVVNLITEKPVRPLDMSVSARYATHNTYDLAGEIRSALFNKKVGLRIFADNYRTEGFSLIPTAIEQTVPPNNNWTINGEVFYDVSNEVNSKLNMRHYSEEAKNTYFIHQNSDTNYINTIVRNYENNIGFKAEHKLSNHYSLDARFYASDYKTETVDTYKQSGKLYSTYQFRHKTGKAEVQSTSLLGEHQIIGGFGGQFEQVSSAAVSGGKRNTSLFYAYLQDDWQVSNKVDMIGSLRFDGHSEYANNISPKIAATWQAIPDLYLRASLGSGFKAPTFEQLYLNWTLASEGYSVFGIKNFPEEFGKLGATGQISDTLYNLNKIKELSPEKSWAIDIGATYSFSDILEIKFNLFRNNVSGLIEFLPVAVKTNGKFVYTYFNLDKIYTQGLETRLRIQPVDFLNIQFHYQLLNTADINVLNSLKNNKQTKYWKREGYNDRPVRPDEYGGLFNRSLHSGSIKFDLNIRKLDFIFSLRAVFKSRYGYADLNGNLILDDDSEYAPGYSFWYLTASKKLFDYFTLQVGVDNLFDYTSKLTRLVTSGRTLYGRLIFKYIIN